jgi:hypothetical protein
VVAVEVGNGTLVGPPGVLPGVPLVPARPGDLVTIYYAGAGGAGPSSVTIGGQYAAPQEPGRHVGVGGRVSCCPAVRVCHAN